MNTTPLSSRARITGLVAAAGVTALIGMLAAAGSAGAGGADRMTVTATATCSADGTPRGVDLYYDDHVDGHVPQSIEEVVLRGSPEGGVEEWTGGGLYQEDGNYFNRRSFSELGVQVDPSATYTYWVTISYDDGVTQTGSALIDLAGACAPAPAPDPDRFGLQQNGFFCGERGERAFVVWHYQDYPDGHYAARADLQVLKNGVLIDQLEVQAPDPSSDGAATEFVIPEGNLSDAPLEVASYSLSMTVTYEDGATDKHIETFDLIDLCNGVVNGRAATPPSTTAPDGASTTTTTIPTGTLPETGASESTWVFAGVRRSRSD